MKTSRIVENFRDKLGPQETLLEGLSPRQIRNVAQFVKSAESLDSLGRLLMSVTGDLNYHTTTLVRVHNLSRNWPRKLREFEKLVRGSSRIIESSLINEFEKLDEITQQEIWESHYTRSIGGNPTIRCADKAFLQLVNTTGFTIKSQQLLVSNVVEKGAETKHSERNTVRAINRKIDYSMPTETFFQDAQELLKNYHAIHTGKIPPGYPESITLEPYKTEMLIMLRALYGEGDVLAMLERFSTAEVLLCPAQMIELLEDWDNIHQFPCEWISEVHHLEHMK